MASFCLQDSMELDFYLKGSDLEQPSHALVAAFLNYVFIRSWTLNDNLGAILSMRGLRLDDIGLTITNHGNGGSSRATIVEIESSFTDEKIVIERQTFVRYICIDSKQYVLQHPKEEEAIRKLLARTGIELF
jgi:hypothetical protein